MIYLNKNGPNPVLFIIQTSRVQTKRDVNEVTEKTNKEVDTRVYQRYDRVGKITFHQGLKHRIGGEINRQRKRETKKIMNFHFVANLFEEMWHEDEACVSLLLEKEMMVYPILL